MGRTGLSDHQDFPYRKPCLDDTESIVPPGALSQRGTGVVSRKIDIPRDRIEDFCRRWQIREFSLFGSVLREDFGPESDVDVLVSFAPEAEWDLFHLVEMRDELMALFGRDVDLVEKEGLRNPFRRRSILDTREVIYHAA
jgi:predicted nucleotidyltransferase